MRVSCGFNSPLILILNYTHKRAIFGNLIHSTVCRPNNYRKTFTLLPKVAMENIRIHSCASYHKVHNLTGVF